MYETVGVEGEDQRKLEAADAEDAVTTNPRRRR
jgi:hypothetical protein